VSRLFVAMGLVLLVGASLSIGVADLWAADIDAGLVMAVSRVPRTVAAVLAGAGLALAGVVVQLSVQNRLVEPSLTGTPEAAMLGLLGITLFAPGSALLVKMGVAAAAALVGTTGFFVLATRVPQRDPILLPLVGLIYGGILGAATLWLAWATDLVQYLGTWTSGEFSGVLRGRYEVLWLIAGLAGLLWLVADRITLLSLGESHARSLGLDYRATRLLGLVIVSLVVAAVVVTVGTLPFVGLVVPNIVSRLRGDNLRTNLPFIAGLGGALILAADVLGRVVRYPYEIPAGTVFSVFGAAAFLWLLNAPRRPAHG